MKKTFLILLFLLTGSLLLRAEKVFVYATADMHGNGAGEAGKGGFLAVTDAILRSRTEKGMDRTLYIDCGDLLQGTLCSAADQGKEAVAALNRGRCDVWVPGNHDFEFSVPVLKQRVGEFRGTFLAGNLEFLSGGSPAGWKLFRRSGKTVAVIGLTNQFLDHWLFDLPGKGIRILRMQEALARIMPEVMKAKPDFIILAVHSGRFAPKRFDGGVNMGWLLKPYPQVDLVLGGHSHECVPGVRLPGGILFAQTGRWAEGYIYGELDRDSRGRTLASTRFVTVETAVFRKNPDAAVTLNAPAFGLKLPLTQAEMTARAVRKAFPEVRVVVQGSYTKFTTPAGKLTVWDVFRHYPYENSVILADLTGIQFRRILKEIASLPPKNRQSVFGAALDAQGHLVLDDGTPWGDAERKTAAFNSFAAAGAGMRSPVLRSVLREKESSARDTGILMRDLLQQYLKGL